MSNCKYMSKLSLLFNLKDMYNLSLMSNFKYMSDLSFMSNPKNLSNLSHISIFMTSDIFQNIEKISIFEARKLGSGSAR